MASIVRIKRRLEDEPAEALLLAPSSKKLKEDVSVDQKVLKFFGTIDSKVRDVKTINKLLEDKKMKSYRDKPAPSERNISKAQASHPLGNRYTITSTFPNPNEGESGSNLKVYDLIREGEQPDDSDTIMCNGVPMVVEKCAAEPKKDVFVYDYYYSEVGTIDDTYLDQLLSVKPFEYTYESYESDKDSQDSNAEDYYTNDYPDTDESCEDFNDDVECLMASTRRMKMNESEEFSYTEDYGFSSDDEDGFTKYKKRVLKELYGVPSSESEDYEDEDEEYLSEIECNDE